eukprot:scaffold759_cov119-Isochrysis_galbana.AAC.9
MSVRRRSLLVRAPTKDSPGPYPRSPSPRERWFQPVVRGSRAEPADDRQRRPPRPIWRAPRSRAAWAALCCGTPYPLGEPHLAGSHALRPPPLHPISPLNRRKSRAGLPTAAIRHPGPVRFARRARSSTDIVGPRFLFTPHLNMKSLRV